MKNMLQKKLVSALIALLSAAVLLCSLAFGVSELSLNVSYASSAASSENNELIFPDGKIIIDSCDKGLRLFERGGGLFAEWSSVQRADYYMTYINGMPFGADSSLTKKDVSLGVARGGNFTLDVYAVADIRVIGKLTCAFRRFITLNSPVNLAVCENVLRWDAVPNATSYSVFVNGTEYKDVRSEFFSLDGIIIAGETYEFSIAAFNDSDEAAYYTPSAEETLTYVAPLLLQNPENLFVALVGARTYLSFTSVTSAAGYSVSIGKIANDAIEPCMEFQLETSCADITDRLNGDGNYVLSVRAYFGSFESEASTLAFRLSKGILSFKEAV